MQTTHAQPSANLRAHAQLPPSTAPCFLTSRGPLVQALTKAGVLDCDSAAAYGSLFSRFMHQSRRSMLDWYVCRATRSAPPSCASKRARDKQRGRAQTRWAHILKEPSCVRACVGGGCRSKISPPTDTLVTEYEDLDACPDISALQTELLNKIAIVKLNGGLGTSMGCKGPKSGIQVRAGLTFLDLTVRQVEYLNTKHGVDVPLILMNSFRTHEATVKLLN
ncbi:MAG: hypothetical protein EOO65_05450, partial [Methanosarcinales archaeon]